MQEIQKTRHWFWILVIALPLLITYAQERVVGQEKQSQVKQSQEKQIAADIDEEVERLLQQTEELRKVGKYDAAISLAESAL
ncbi:MAG: hypothetical protein ACRD9R_18445 [Pyrinomonadaceae bacterium]